MNSQSLQIKFETIDERINSESRHRKKDIQDLERDLNKRLDYHHHTLYGNGQPGLKSEVQELKTTIHVIIKLLKWQIGIMIPFLVCSVGVLLSWLLEKI